jgi:hypothetical protein
MTSKALVVGLASLFAVSAALAQTASESISNSPQPRINGPMRLIKAVPGNVTSENWSGYAVTGKDFTFAKGSWHVPEVDCTKTPNTYSAFWVGLDGYSDKTVEQTGTSSDCNGTTPVYYAWYEFYPAGSVVISSMTISPGDVIGASVSYENGQFTIGIHDHNTGEEFKISQVVSGAQRSSAEWIAEAPCCTSSGGILPLADFVTANYGYDHTSDPGTNYATDSTEDNKPIVDFGKNVQKITMISAGDVTEAVPTALSSDGTSFTVDWKSE